MMQRVVDYTLSVAVDSVFHPPEKHKKRLVHEEAGVKSTGETVGQGFHRVYPEG